MPALVDPIYVKVWGSDGKYREYRMPNTMTIQQVVEVLRRKPWWNELPLDQQDLFYIEGRRPYRSALGDGGPNRRVVLANKPERMDD